MSGWTLATLRAREGQDYEYAKYDDRDPHDAIEDIVASAQNDDRVRDWSVNSPEVYLYFNFSRYAFGSAEAFLEDYAFMVEDAVLVGANDTTDTGVARYYPVREHGVECMHEYDERQGVDGYHVGYKAMAVMYAQHGIQAWDPWHDWTGRVDDMYGEDGVDRVH